MFIGAHVSVAGGIDKAVGRGVEMGAEALQVFGGPPQSYQAIAYPDEQTENFKRQAAEAGLGPTWFHGIYLINLASSNPETVKKSADSLISYMQLCARIGGAGVLFHTGSHLGRSFESVRKHVIEQLNSILEATPSHVKLALENSAGQGGTIGARFQELAELIQTVQSDRLGVCFDTQHAFAAGYNVATKDGLQRTIDELHRTVGLDRLWVVHANDSQTELGSERDRHANIGEGAIGIEGFKVILSHPAFQKLPVYLEVPGDDGKSGPDRENLDRLKEIRDAVAS